MNLKATRRNEKRKLAAMWFNGVSIASSAIGIFTPVATAIYDLERREEVLANWGSPCLDRWWLRPYWSLSAGHS